jgi:hypothetical protein
VGAQGVEDILRKWRDEQMLAVELCLFRFGVSGTLVAVQMDPERGSVRVTNAEGRSVDLAASAETVMAIASMLYAGPARYHVSSSSVTGSVAVLWMWTNSRSRCFVVAAVAEVLVAA